MSDESSLPPPEERRKEREVGHAVIFIVRTAKENWKTLAVIFALLFNSPYARPIIESVFGVKLAPQLKAAATVMEQPVGENWKTMVERRLGNIEKQQKKIITLLTDQ